MVKGNRAKESKTRKKWLILVLILVFVLLAAVAAFFLLGQNSEGKRQYEAKLQQDANTFTAGLVAELDQIDTSDEGINENDTDEDKKEVITEAEQQMLEAELAKLEDDRKRKVLKTLTAAYSQTLQAQKQEAIRQVEALVNQGKADWVALSAKGENTAANKGLLASEYMAKVGALEGQMDASFQTLLTKMEKQLESEGIDPAPIIQEYQSEYKRIKEENRSAMMDKAMNAIKN